MSGLSKIEWTESTWNPIVGCSIVSPGCTHCYAMTMAARIEAMGSAPHYAGTTKRVNGNAVWTGKLALAPEKTLTEPLRRKKPTTYFVNSMGDLFHEDAPDEWIDRVFRVMAMAKQHQFQVLTKRADRMRAYCSTIGRELRIRSQEIAWPLPNVWLGVSAERQKEADERIPLLLETPAAIRFVSCEPLLGPIDLRDITDRSPSAPQVGEHHFSALPDPDDEPGAAYLDWIIVGGESGAGARPMHPDWARSIRRQCFINRVPFFFKQWGAWASVSEVAGPGEHFSFSDGATVRNLGKKTAGRVLDGREWNEMPEARP